MSATAPFCPECHVVTYWELTVPLDGYARYEVRANGATTKELVAGDPDWEHVEDMNVVCGACGAQFAHYEGDDEAQLIKAVRAAYLENAR